MNKEREIYLSALKLTRIFKNVHSFFQIYISCSANTCLSFSYIFKKIRVCGFLSQFQKIPNYSCWGSDPSLNRTQSPVFHFVHCRALHSSQYLSHFLPACTITKSTDHICSLCHYSLLFLNKTISGLSSLFKTFIMIYLIPVHPPYHTSYSKSPLNYTHCVCVYKGTFADSVSLQSLW